MKTRLFLLVVLLALSLGLPAQARVGETEEQLTARYGQGSVPWKATDSYPVSVQMFYKGGTTITVMLIDGISVGEAYEQKSGVTEEAMMKLLDTNAQGHKWTAKAPYKTEPGEPISKVFMRDDGAFAYYKVPYVLVIKSKQLKDADEAKEAADKKAGVTTLEGF